MSDFKKVQLFKLAKELGVTTDRLEDHLKGHGFASALKGSGLMAAVTNEEAYFALLQEFSSDKEQVSRLREAKVQEAARLEAERVRREEEERRRAEEEEQQRIEAERQRAEEEAERRRAEEEAARQAAEEAARQQEASAPVAEAAPSADAPVEAPVAEAEALPASEEAEVAPTGEEATAEDETDENVLRADRYQLEGTKVLGKIDLGSVGAGSDRRGKRPRKAATEAQVKPDDARKALQEAFSSSATPATPGAPAAGGQGGGARRKDRGGKGRRGGPQVDEQEVEQNLAENLRAMQQGTGRTRQQLRRARRDERAEQRARDAEAEEMEAGILRVTEFITTGELANLMDVAVTEVISTLFASGVMASINQRLDADTIQIVAAEFGYDVQFIRDLDADDEEIEAVPDDPASLEPRPPVVTVMGHVDHGKTSLLDYIRSANVVSGEAGGITQHIGAYAVQVGERSITFLDTPGHEAFTAMRARGAQATDIVILVVAADDAVMPQTIEAINHAKAASVPMVVAVNKIDKPEANPPKVMQQLSEHGVLVEQYGGQVQSALVSAKQGTGVDELLEQVVLQADLLELKANPNREAQGLVIESRLDRGRGVVATVLVQNGTLRVGDAFVAGIHSGRVRAMFNERDERVDEAGPGTPVAVLGFAGAPEVGDRFHVMEEREARETALRRQQIHREQALRQRKHITLDEIGRRLALGDFRQLNLVIKGDVGGSVEALSDSLLKLSAGEVAVQIIHSGVGAITESDVMLATASDAVIIGFNVRPTAGARQTAEREEIDIRIYSIIYDAIQEVRDALEGLLSPEQSEKTLGTVEVRQIFRVPKVGTVAGCMVTEGKIRRNDKIRLVRDGVVVLQSAGIASLKRVKDDVREVASGYECGISLEGFNDVKEGDVIEAYEIVETKRRLATA
jgi:translation initiation factor IF-2